MADAKDTGCGCGGCLGLVVIVVIIVAVVGGSSSSSPTSTSEPAVSTTEQTPPPPTETSTPEPSPSEGTHEPAGEEDEVGSASHAGDTKFCEEKTCIGSFTSEEGTVVECSDGSYSHAGGISGACSHHGGEKE